MLPADMIHHSAITNTVLNFIINNNYNVYKMFIKNSIIVKICFTYMIMIFFNLKIIKIIHFFNFDVSEMR